jgi:hypothetical protein
VKQAWFASHKTTYSITGELATILIALLTMLSDYGRKEEKFINYK